VSEGERRRALYALMDMNPGWGPRKLEEVTGMSHVNIIKLQRQRAVREHLQAHGTKELSNSIMEVLFEAEQHAWDDLAKVINFEHWGPTDLKATIKRARAISDTDWSELDDGHGRPVSAGQDWQNLRESLRLRLSYRAIKDQWTDEELVRCASYARDLDGAADESNTEKEWRKQAREELRQLLRGDLSPESWKPEPDHEPES
jgi:hypothetical protein